MAPIRTNSFRPFSPLHRGNMRVVTLSEGARTTVPKLSHASVPQPSPLHRTSGPLPHASTQHSTIESTNWSGEIVTGSTYTAINGEWTVPSVVPSESAEYSASWIGIDGVGNSTLIQTGTSQDTDDGSTSYYAWVELLPAVSVPIEDAPVSPGDAMDADIVETSPDVWRIEILDMTQNWFYQQSFDYSTPGASAEWIEEAPTVDGSQSALANFGSTTFSVTGLSTTGVGLSVLNPVFMTNPADTEIIAYPGAYNYGTGSFTITFGSPPVDTSTDVSVNPSQVTSGQSVTYSASVTSSDGVPTGTVTFSVGSVTLCTTSPLASGSGSCASTTAQVGADSVAGAYSGASGFVASTGSATLQVFDTPGVYVPLTPERICDTRPENPSGLTGSAAQCGAGGFGRTLTTGGVLNFGVTGEFGVPSTDVSAVVLNVTAVSPAAAGYFTLFPAGQATPLASNLNFLRGQIVPNLVEVGVGAGGDVSLLSSAPADAVIDLEGYVTTTAQSGAGLYNALASPARICDTRGSNPSFLSGGDTQCNPDTAPGSPDNLVGPSNPITVTVAGNGGVPATGVSAAVLNVTVTNPQAAGYVTAFPAGEAQPGASDVNYLAGQTVANRLIVPVNSDGQITLIAAADTDVIVDVSGYYTATGGTTGSEFTPELAPVRICDTRGSDPSELTAPYSQCNTDTASGSPNNPLGASTSISVQAMGLGDIPSGAAAVVLNMTAIAPTASTYLAVYPGGTIPTTSDINPPIGSTVPNLVVATLTGGGAFSVFNAGGQTNVVIDVAGWYSPV